MKSKKVMIHAYANFNLGDDLFIKILCERYPRTQFILYARSEYKYLFKKTENLKIYEKDKFLNRFRNYLLGKFRRNFSLRDLIAENCDAVVRIGGSIFMQSSHWGDRRTGHNLAKHVPYFVLGANFGPFSDPYFYQYHYELFQNYTDICFRDNYSYNLFSDLPNVRRADDIVFQLEPGVRESEKNNIVISVIKPSYRKELKGYDEMYYMKIIDIIEFFTKKDYTITLMSFCKNEGDQEAIDEILKLVSPAIKQKVYKYYYKYNIDEALNVIASSCYVIATRFHAMILGWLYNKPVFPIAYSKKMNNVMNDINYSGTFIDLKTIHSLKIQDVYHGKVQNFVDTSLQVENSEQHFEKLDKFLSI